MHRASRRIHCLATAALTAAIGTFGLGNGPARAVCPTFTPMPRALLFSSDTPGNLDIFGVNPDGSGLVNLTNDPTAVDGYAAWSPDGSRIAFQSACGGNIDIYVINADGAGLTRLTTDPADDGLPSWSPDGAWIAFTSTRVNGSTGDIWKMKADGTNQTRLTTSNTDESYAAWSPDGTQIAYISPEFDTERDVCVMNPDGSSRHAITGVGTTEGNRVSWSNDSARIYFSSQRGPHAWWDIFVMDRNGSNVHALTNDAAEDAHAVLSPDGTRIAFCSQRDTPGFQRLFVMNVDGSGITRLTPAVNRNDGTPAWGSPCPTLTPALTDLVFETNMTGNYEIFGASGCVNSLVNMTVSSLSDESYPRWSPGRSRLLFGARCGGNSDIYVINADGTGLKRLTTDPADDGAANWSPDGLRIVFVSTRSNGSGDIWVMNADGTNQTRLTTSPTDESYPAWSPDGTQIAYVSPEFDSERDVCVMNTDGSNRHPITGVGTTEGNSLSWTRDSATIYFSSQRGPNGWWDIYRMNRDGSNVQAITNDAPPDGDPAISPDGSVVAFVSQRDTPGHYRLFVRNALALGPIVRVTPAVDADDGNPAWRTITSVPCPTPVVLSDVQVAASADGVHLAWKTSEEVDHAFFGVFRSTEIGGAFAQVNDRPILGAGQYEYLDATAAAGSRYWYKIAAYSRGGDVDYFGPYAVDAEPGPARLAVSAATPNPFQLEASFAVTLSEQGALRVTVHDVAGRLVRQIAESDRLEPGRYAYAWDGQRADGSRAPRGIYFVRVKSGGETRTIRLVLIRN